MLRGVIFDLDGTLGDTLPVCFAAFRAVFEGHLGKTFSDDEIRAMFGPTEEGILAEHIPGDGSQAMNSYLDAYAAAHHLAPRPFKGIETLLDELDGRGVPAAVVTGKGPQSAALSLAHWGLAARFPIVKAGGDHGNIKDANMAAVVEHWDVAPSDVVSVGDAPSDVTAARSVGIFAAAAGWASTTDATVLAAAGPDELFHTVQEFASWLGRR